MPRYQLGMFRKAMDLLLPFTDKKYMIFGQGKILFKPPGFPQHLMKYLCDIITKFAECNTRKIYAKGSHFLCFIKVDASRFTHIS